MAETITLVPGKPVTTKDPNVEVKGEFAAGSYVFSLVVIDDGGLASRPVTLLVKVSG